MPTTKRASKKKPPSTEAGPKASRPDMQGYGIPEDTKGLLPWSHVEERMSKAMHYWICTVSPGGRPHSTPVDGLWVDGKLYFGGSPTTRRHRNLAENSAVCVHLENCLDVVILHGDAQELHAVDVALTIRLAAQSKEKYGWGPKPEDYAKGGVFVFSPRMVLAWKQFPKDVTRWRLTESG